MDISQLPLYIPEESYKVKDRIYKTEIDGLFFIQSPIHADDRGFYREMAIIPDLEVVLNHSFIIKQLNHSRSNTNVIRGFHSENWNKLITVASGTCLCVLADIRPESPTFLKSVYFYMGDGENSLKGSFFVTKGIANSFLVLNGPSDYIYAVDETYRDRDTSRDTAISLFDENLNISWPLRRDNMIISERDQNSIKLQDLYPEKFF